MARLPLPHGAAGLEDAGALVSTGFAAEGFAPPAFGSADRERAGLSAGRRRAGLEGGDAGRTFSTAGVGSSSDRFTGISVTGTLFAGTLPRGGFPGGIVSSAAWAATGGRPDLPQP